MNSKIDLLNINKLREKLKQREPSNSIFDPPYSTLQVGGIFGGIRDHLGGYLRQFWDSFKTVLDLFNYHLITI